MSVIITTPVFRSVISNWKDDRGKILSAIAFGWFLSTGVRLAYPVMIPYLQTAYGLTLSTAGFLLTILWVAYALGQLPGGVIGDKIGEGVTMTASMLIAAFTLLFIVTSKSVSILFLGTALFGFALSLFGTVRLSALSDIYPENRGTAIGLISAAGDVGNTLLPPVAGFITATIYWQLGFGFSIPLFVLSGICIWLIVPSRTSESRSSGTSLSSSDLRRISENIFSQRIIIIFSIQVLSNSVYQAFTGFYPTYLINIKGLSPEIANGLFALFFAFGAIIKPISGRSFDSIGAKHTLVILMGVSGIGFAILPLIDGVIPLIMVTAIVGAMGGRGTVTLSYMTVSLPDDLLNTGLGTLRTSYMFIGAMSPTLFGFVADQGYFDEAFVLLAVISVVCFLLAWILPDV